jgi:hypothetical protein
MTMGIQSLKANLKNPARQYLWEVVFPEVIGGGDGTILTFRCQSAEMPEEFFGNINIDYKQTAGVVYPGRRRLSHELTLQFVEGEDRKVFEAMYNWRQQIIHNENGIGAGDDSIKTDVYIKLLNTTGDEAMSIRLQGCYPKKTAGISLDYTADAVIRPEVTFSFDNWVKNASND